MYALLACLFVTPYFQAVNSQSFISPPNSGSSSPYSATVGETIHATWQCEYVNINFNVYGPLSNGAYPYLALFQNQANTNSYTFELGQNLLGLSPDNDQNNNTYYWLKIEQVDPSSGNNTGDWFATEQFPIYLPAEAASSSAAASLSTNAATATIVVTASSEPAGSASDTTTPTPTTSLTTTSSSGGGASQSASAASQTAGGGGGYSQSDKITLGCSLGLGIPAALLAVWKIWKEVKKCLRRY